MHTPSGDRKIGVMFALTTVFCWAGLPIVLKLLLLQVDALTLTWIRFLVAGVILGVGLLLRGNLPNLRRTSTTIRILLLFATLGLAGNYFFYLQSLAYITAGVAQVFIQIAPIIFIFGSILIYKESFSPIQMLGTALLIAGMPLFFHHRLGDFWLQLTGPAGESKELIGLGLMFIAALTWTVYALAQKQILTQVSPQGLLLVIYLGSALLLWPFAEPTNLLVYKGVDWWLLAFACINTVIAYGAFSEALSHMEASRVSAVLTITPLLSLALVEIGALIWPMLMQSENLDWISYTGAVLIVGGCMATALGSRRPKG